MSPVVANFTCSGNFINVNGHVNYTDLSVGTITSWQWSFQGGNPATSTIQSPQNIMYDTPGTYTVTLTVSDGTHNSTETKTAFVTVQPPANSAWIEQASGFSTLYRGVYHISIVNDSIAWATAIDGTNGSPVNEFTRTVNAGNLWTPGTITVTGALAPANISAVSDTEAWVAEYPTTGAGGKVYHTSDGGQTWTNQTSASMFTNTASFLDVVHFFNKNDGFCVGDAVSSKFEIYYTHDGGQTWTAVDVANNPAAQSGEMGWTGVYDAYNNIAWFGTNKGRIFKTTDKGETWTVLTPGLTDISKIAFNNENNGITQQIVFNTTTGAITTLTMKNTTDGGQTWTTVTPGSDFWKSDIAAVPNIPGKFYSVGSDGAASASAKYGSSYSLDYGTTWTPIDTGVQYVCVKFFSDQTGWSGGFSTNATTSGVFKWDYQTIVKPLIQNANIRVYPNPATDFVTVESSDHIISIEVINQLGQQVMYKNTHAPTSTLYLDGLSKGLYLLKINTVNGSNMYKVFVK
jgi:photosystem II stability/assembly factor-like uncharacterized protein